MDLLQDGDYAAARAVAGLLPLMTKLERLIGRPAELDLAMLVKYATAVLFGSEYSIDAFLLARQIGKGHLFAAALAQGPPVSVLADAEARRLLDLVQDSENAIAAGDRRRLVDDAAVFLDSNRLVAYAGARESSAGLSERERLVNRRRSFDAFANRLLLSGAGRTALSLRG